MAQRALCEGDGCCWEQSEDDMDLYERAFDCPHNCALVKCPNFAVCGSAGPLWVIQCHDGLCADCAVIIGGPLQIVTLPAVQEGQEGEECAVCLEAMTAAVQHGACSHRSCTSCFRRMLLGARDVHQREEPSDDEEYAAWEEALQAEMTRLRNCPLCRAPMVRDRGGSGGTAGGTGGAAAGGGSGQQGGMTREQLAVICEVRFG
jgi:hypothetical protein